MRQNCTVFLIKNFLANMEPARPGLVDQKRPHNGLGGNGTGRIKAEEQPSV